MMEIQPFCTFARCEQTSKTFVNPCKTWFRRRGTFYLKQAPPKSQKSPFRHTFFSKKCVKMIKNHGFGTLERGERS